MTIKRANEAKLLTLLQGALVAPEVSTISGGVVDLEQLLAAFYRNTNADDLLLRDPADIVGAAVSLAALARSRNSGVAAVRVITPTVTNDGWATERSVVEIVTDDMPFVVDSVIAALNQAALTINMVIHPIMSGDGGPESWVHLEIDRETDPVAVGHLELMLGNVLADVRAAVEDWRSMHDKAKDLAQRLDESPPSVIAPGDAREASELFDWLADDHFTFLGYREYDLVVDQDGSDVLVSKPETGLGLLRAQEASSTSLALVQAEVAAKAREPHLLVLTKANRRSTVHRPAYLDYFSIKRFDELGKVVGEFRFVGLLSATTYADSATQIPVVRQTIERAMTMSGFSPGSHSARDLLQFCETYPRDEMFQITAEKLLAVGVEVMAIGERRQTRLFLRNDDYGRFVSVLVYLPRDRYTTDVRLQITAVLADVFGSELIDYVTRISESVLARLHFVVRMPAEQPIAHVDERDLMELIKSAIRTWDDDFADAMLRDFGEARAEVLRHDYAQCLPEAYKEFVAPGAAAADIGRLDSLVGSGASSVHLHDPIGSGVGDHRLTLYRIDQPVVLYEILPIFASLGVKVLEERPYELTRSDGSRAWIYDVGIKVPVSVTSEGVRGSAAELFCDAFQAAWRGECETDRLNALVPIAGLTWRQVWWIRTWVQYARQLGSPFSYTYFEDVVLANSGIASMLVQLFAARLDPDLPQSYREVEGPKIGEAINAAIDEVANLDADRVLRQLHGIVRAVLRTNAFQVDGDGRSRPTVTIKLDSKKVPNAPSPIPMYELWVCSPRVSALHMRFGPVARGGLRWSDRPEDFRTEILGLVKAQAVKNAVIVPVGAKGGFVVKRPRDSSDRGSWSDVGIACYREFITAMLQVTDNLKAGEVIAPERTVRLDSDDPYLVVAADKGTASFSDIANAIALDHGFWLGDAFASGGSVGYDHKAMGITARGAWESVKRHFREMGTDTQSEPFTVVGVGDMSGDVFGNGMLLSETIQLVAAFDHRHIFIDPSPEAATSFAERARLFELPRSSWAEYNQELISAGGGVFDRSLKQIDITEQMRAALGLPADITTMRPNDLVHAILLAPVDLLFNGGIGTYVKASTETDLAVGDRANDSLRVDGRQLRCKVVGEGGNLGLTQSGRIEAARVAGVRLNTDAIDNSAGVDCSDHEVNIKILLGGVVSDGELTTEQRNELLVEMTDDVAKHVLASNYRQNLLLAKARAQAPGILPVHRRLIDSLEARGLLDRKLEYLPSDAELADRAAAGEGLSSPELSVLLAYVKMALTEDLIDSSLADESWAKVALRNYFPPVLVERYLPWLDAHPLRGQIIATVVANDLVDWGGVSFVHRAVEETGASAVEVVRAYTVARDVFRVREVWNEICELDGVIPTEAQAAMFLEVRRLLDRATRWVLALRGGTVDVAGEIDRFGATVARLDPVLTKMIVGAERTRLLARVDNLVALGAPQRLAFDVASALDRFSELDIEDLAQRYQASPTAVAEVYFAVSEHYGIDKLLQRVSSLPRSDFWANLARASLRSDLYSVIAGLTSKVLRSTDPDDPAESRLAQWETRNFEGQQRARQTLSEIEAADHYDLAALSVAVRVLRTLIQQGTGPRIEADSEIDAQDADEEMGVGSRS